MRSGQSKVFFPFRTKLCLDQIWWMMGVQYSRSFYLQCAAIDYTPTKQFLRCTFMNDWLRQHKNKTQRSLIHCITESLSADTCNLHLKLLNRLRTDAMFSRLWKRTGFQCTDGDPSTYNTTNWVERLAWHFWTSFIQQHIFLKKLTWATIPHRLR